MPTSPTLPPEIVVLHEGPDEVRYRLPPRELSGGRWLGWGAILGGAALFIGTLLSIYSVAALFLGLPPLPLIGGSVTFVGVLFVGFSLRAGLLPIWWGVKLLFGQREIEVNHDHLKVVDQCGLLRRSRRWKVETISSLHVRPLAWGPNAPTAGPLGEVMRHSALDLHLQGGKHFTLAWAYPESILAPLAETLAARCERAAEIKNFAQATRAERTPIRVTRADLTAAPTDATVDDEIEMDYAAHFGAGNSLELNDGGAHSPPPNTQIVFDRLENGEFTITVPPAGVWKGSQGLFFFSLLWCGFMMLFTSIMVGSQVNGKDQERLPILAFLFVGLFWAVGIGMLLSALNMGRRRAAIALVGGRLMTITSGLFGSKKRDWAVEEIVQVRVGPSGLEVNDRPVLELQIIGPEGKEVGMLSERDEDELKWLAWEIRQSLQQQAPAGDES